MTKLYSSITYDDYLEHYGIKGMKWGVRKDRKTNSEPSERDHRLLGKYKAEGMTDEEASKRLERNRKIRKAVLVTGGVAATAAAAYVGTKEFDKRFKGVDLDMNTSIKNVNVFGDELMTDRRLYVTVKESDSKKYRGMYAEQLRKQNPWRDAVYETTLTARERIKAPSHREAKKLFKEYRESLSSSDKRKTPADYIQFNQRLVMSGTGGKDTSINTGFYNMLKEKGYNSLIDSNDQFKSGYDTRKPLIVFNAAKTLNTIGHNVVKENESKKLARGQAATVVGKIALKQAGYTVAGVSAAKAIGNYGNKKAVDAYLEEHPNSKKSRADVYEMLERGEL